MGTPKTETFAEEMKNNGIMVFGGLKSILATVVS